MKLICYVKTVDTMLLILIDMKIKQVKLNR
uniref:Uncharacterized protein n=1 Tax=Anguilla anguilla TaxID=7936 RepID=A0A0E9UUM7_ANGAN